MTTFPLCGPNYFLLTFVVVVVESCNYEIMIMVGRKEKKRAIHLAADRNVKLPSPQLTA